LPGPNRSRRRTRSTGSDRGAARQPRPGRSPGLVVLQQAAVSEQDPDLVKARGVTPAKQLAGGDLCNEEEQTPLQRFFMHKLTELARAKVTFFPRFFTVWSVSLKTVENKGRYVRAGGRGMHAREGSNANACQASDFSSGFDAIWL